MNYALQCPGLASSRPQLGAVYDAASNLEYKVPPHTDMELLFKVKTFDLAGYLSRAYKRRFSALNGFMVCLVLFVLVV